MISTIKDAQEDFNDEDNSFKLAAASHPSESAPLQFQCLMSQSPLPKDLPCAQHTPQRLVRTRSDTTLVNSNPVLTQYVSPRSRFPLVLIPTPHLFPLYPTSDHASFIGTLIPFRMFPFVLVSLRTMSSLFPTPDPYLRRVARTRSGLPSDLGRLMSSLVT